MYQPTWHRLFDKNLKRGFELLKSIIAPLCAAELLTTLHKDHPLSGEGRGAESAISKTTCQATCTPH